MTILWLILKIILFTFVMIGVTRLSHNILFTAMKKPWIWIVLMLVASFLFFWIGSVIQNSFNAVWWSALLTFFSLLPPSNKSTNIDTIDSVYEDWGIHQGRIKYRLGVSAFAVGSIAGWFVFYS